MPYRTLRLCAHGGGFEAIPDRAGAVDLARVRAELERAGIAVIDARVLLIAQTSPEVTLSRSGRLLIKTTDPRRARELFERFVTLAGLGPVALSAPGR